MIPNTADSLPLYIGDLDEDGAGVGLAGCDELGGAQKHAPGPREIHVPGALPGERVTARVQHLSSHRAVAWAGLVSVDGPSPDRVAPACAAHGRCGGCTLQHLDVRAQLAWKEARLRASLAGHAALAGVPVHAAVASPRSLGYRNNSKLVVAADPSGAIVLGGYAPRSHDVVSLAGCRVVEPILDQVAASLGPLIEASDLRPYDERTLLGTLRYVVLRSSARADVLVTLVTASDDFPDGAALAADLRARHPGVVGVVHNANPTRGNVLYGAVERLLAGQATIEDRIGDVRLRISSRAFFQANRDVAAAAYRAIVDGLAPRRDDVVVDLYAGVGGIALTLAKHVAQVIGVEEHAQAVDDAVASARLNAVTNARFVAGDAAEQLALLAEGGGSNERPTLVVLNPPRKGCSNAVLAALTALAPRAIAYLSCAPDTLARDLAVLARAGYSTRALTPFDMLPHTTHLEALAVVSK